MAREQSSADERAVVLVADDDPVTRKLLDHHLKQANFDVVAVSDGMEAIDRLGADLALAIVDLQMPRADGLAFLRTAQARFPELPVLMISRTSEVKVAVRAMQEGAHEYVTKPIEPEELIARVKGALRSRRLLVENRQLRQAVASPMPETELVGMSAGMRTLMAQVEKIAPLDATILITGESGVGKTTLARRIHQAGPRRDGPFIAVGCAALPRDLIEAELFGHQRGAFTGAIGDRPGRAEMADGGTLFLDEIGDLPLDLQPKLLTFLQDRVVQRIGDHRARPVDVRVIAATHQDLTAKCREGTFRQDLYFRLAVLMLTMPPLRDRLEDIPFLARSLLDKIARRRKCATWDLSPEATALLVPYPWLGNVRELENVLERATAFSNGRLLSVEDLGLPSVAGSSTPVGGEASRGQRGLAGLTLEEIEREAIVQHLAAQKGNKRAAARSLGIDEKSIYNKMRRLGLS